MTAAACSVDGCDGEAKATGFCWTHYGRWRRNGDPLKRGQHGGARPAKPRPLDPPDPRPVRALRAQFEYDRREDRSFAFAWSHALEAALGSLPAGLKAEWAEVLAEHRTVWRDAYHHELPEPLKPIEMLRRYDEDVEPFAVHRRSAPGVVTTGQRHDQERELAPVVVSWCR